MKGTLKAIKRTPHMLTTKVGMSNKSTDAETDELTRKFAGLEDYTNKLIKDTSTFRDAINTMLTAQVGFGDAFATIFQPILNEHSLSAKYPQAANTLRNIASYQEVMTDLRDAIQPELDLLDSRVTAPLKEYQDLVKKVRKTVTKREHKLLDYDRFNNSYLKLKDKKEKSLSDEKHLFKLEQDLEVATQEYEHYNTALKNEVPHFLALTTAFIAPLFQTFYFVKVGILYTLLERMQTWSGQTYGEAGQSVEGLEAMHQERIGDTVEQLDNMTVTKRYAGSAKLLAEHRQNSGSSAGGFGLNRANSSASSLGSARPAYAPGSPSAAAAPPPYTGAPATALAGKRPAPPPPAPRPKAGVQYATALYDYVATAAGDLSFSAGDKIEIVKKSESTEDWWTGKLNGVEGVFPGNYVQV